MNDTSQAEDAWAEGTDFDWLLTRGAEMTWHYGFAVQSGIADMAAAHAAEDWPTCVAVCTATLEALVECGYRGMGISDAAPEAERRLRLASDPSAIAAAYRCMPSAAGAGRETAEATLAIVREFDTEFRSRLPWEVPLLRSQKGSRQSIRMSASFTKWRAIRGIGGTETAS